MFNLSHTRTQMHYHKCMYALILHTARVLNWHAKRAHVCVIQRTQALQKNSNPEATMQQKKALVHRI